MRNINYHRQARSKLVTISHCHDRCMLQCHVGDVEVRCHSILSHVIYVYAAPRPSVGSWVFSGPDPSHGSWVGLLLEPQRRRSHCSGTSFRRHVGWLLMHLCYH